MRTDSRHISTFSVIVSFLALALLGCALLPLIPVKLVPSEDMPAIGVSFSMPGSSARTVEAEVTCRLEGALSRIDGVKYIDSRSRKDGGFLTLEFDAGTDLAVARFETAMAIRRLWSSLPPNVSYPQIDVRQVNDDAAKPFMSFTINSSLSGQDIMRYAEENIRPVLSKLPGVAKVALSGTTPMEWEIVYDNVLASSLDITDNDISRALAATEHIDSPALDKIVVKNRNGHLVTLDKIASIRHRAAAPTDFFRINGLNSIYLNITAADNANQLKLSKDINHVLSRIRLPQGFAFTLLYDASQNIAAELNKIYFRTILTVLILLVFVGLITMNWHYLLLIAVSLAINIAVSFVAYYLCKVEIQLYSLAAITISLNLVIDNLIVMTEHITRRGNLKAFTAVLAATLTTVGALSVVFFLDEQTMLSLKDFVAVVIINLSVSLLVALFLVPALVQRLGIVARKHRHYTRAKLAIVPMHVYSAVVSWLCRHKRLTFAALILAFGLPVFLLPESMEGNNTFASFYNSTLGKEKYKENIKPWVDRCLGGSLRLFAQKVSNGSYLDHGNDEPIINVNATLPNGATLQQMDKLVAKMEECIGSQAAVRQFQTNIFGPRRASISVFLKPVYQRSEAPYVLKADIIAKALTLGGGSWSVFGLEDQGFSNDVRQVAGEHRIKLAGYNYDKLWDIAKTVGDSLLKMPRVTDITVNSDFSFWKDDYTEFVLDIDRQRLAKDSLTVQQLLSIISHHIKNGEYAGSVHTSEGLESIVLSSDGKNDDVWSLSNAPMLLGQRMVKLTDYASIKRQQAPPDIVKFNQEYVLCLQYGYIGSSRQAAKLHKRIIESFSRSLPMGYHIEDAAPSWNFGQDATHYALLGLIAVIIFFVSAILFNSLRQPVAIISVIPVSFIGVFLTFYLFDLKFDQGGFAAFILLCGITVNAAIYIISEYNALRRKLPSAVAAKLYFRAFRAKITTILLTVLSTVLGFIPFLIGETRETFWYSLAAGTMGGLVMSMAAVFFVLPLFIIKPPKKNQTTVSR